MKNYAIGVLAVAVLFLGSVIYRQQNTMVYHHFPVPESLKEKSADTPPTLYLFLFFSKKNCPPCLEKIVEVLNTLPPQFRAAGIAPEEELADESELRRLTGIPFPLYSYKKYKKYLPGHTPTLFGVSPSGKVIFVFPGIKGQWSNLESVLISTSDRKIYASVEVGDKGGKRL